MIAAIITDYERAVLDELRMKESVQRAVDGLAEIPETPEIKQYWLRKLTDAESREQHELSQEKLRLYYKARGYKPPYEYGKGRVKVMARIADDWEQ